MFATNGLDSFITCDNSMDANGAEHDSLGRFTGKQKKDLQRSDNNSKVKVFPRGKNKIIIRSIRGFKTKMSDIVRYNPKTNDFAVGHPLIGIRSMFKPRSGASYFENKFKKKGE